MPKAHLSQTSINYAKQGPWPTAGEPVVPLVLVHGLAASSAFWYGVTQQLPATLPILTYDLRGHGRSKQTETGYTVDRMAEDLWELLDSLGIDSVHLCGHSFGGSVALRAAFLKPERVASLILADSRVRLFQPLLTPANWPKWQARKEKFAELGFAMSDDEADAGVRLLTELARFQVEDAKHAESQLPAWMNEFFGQRQSLFAATRWLELTSQTTILQDITDESWLSLELLGSLPMRLLAVYGSESPVYASGVRLKGLLPDTDFKTVAGAGHFFPASRPAELAGPLKEFLGLSTDFTD